MAAVPAARSAALAATPPPATASRGIWLYVIARLAEGYAEGRLQVTARLAASPRSGAYAPAQRLQHEGDAIQFCSAREEYETGHSVKTNERYRPRPDVDTLGVNGANAAARAAAQPVAVFSSPRNIANAPSNRKNRATAVIRYMLRYASDGEWPEVRFKRK